MVGRGLKQLLFGRVLLIYQMPKVGSQSLEASLDGIADTHEIVRLHFLSKKNAAHIRRCLQWKDAAPGWKREAVAQLKLLERTARGLRLRRVLVACGLTLPKLQTITGVRDVIGMALSTIFENHNLFVSSPALLTTEKCLQLLNRPHLCPQLQNWFDEELRPHLGIDVYARPFPREAGYCVYENRFARVLLYRFDALPRLPDVLGDFLGTPVEALSKRNIGESKGYGELYRNVREQLRLPLDFVDLQLNSKLMRHFYSEAERAAFRQRWAAAPEPTGLEGTASPPLGRVPSDGVEAGVAGSHSRDASHEGGQRGDLGRRRLPA